MTASNPLEPRSTPTYRSLNKPLTLLGVERRLFFLALAAGTATFNLFSSLIGGIGMSLLLYGFGFWATAKDPAILSILLSATGTRASYDPLKPPREGVS